MLIAVSSENDEGINSLVSGHFGRCPFFTLVKVNDDKIGQVTNVENPFFNQHSPGQVPAFIEKLGADVILAGGMGQRAIVIFQEKGIKGVSGASGTVEEAVGSFLSGNRDGFTPCRGGHGKNGGGHKDH